MELSKINWLSPFPSLSCFSWRIWFIPIPTWKSFGIVLFVFSLIPNNLELRYCTSVLFLFGTNFLRSSSILNNFGIVLFVFSSILNIGNYICSFPFDPEKFRTSSLRYCFVSKKFGTVQFVFSSIPKGLELGPLFLFDPEKLGRVLFIFSWILKIWNYICCSSSILKSWELFIFVLLRYKIFFK